MSPETDKSSRSSSTGNSSGLGPAAPWYAKFFDRMLFSWLSKFSSEAKALLICFVVLVAGISYSLPKVILYVQNGYQKEHEAFSEDLKAINNTVMELIRELHRGHNSR